MERFPLWDGQQCWEQKKSLSHFQNIAKELLQCWHGVDDNADVFWFFFSSELIGKEKVS